MKVTPTRIPDVLIIEPQVFGDDRGFFFESFNQKAFNEAVGQEIAFVQDNHSKSVKNVLGGLQYQLPPTAQGKLVRVVQGEVFDVAVDIRKGLSTYGQWVDALLSADNMKQMWISPDFAHGFLTLSDTVEFIYKTTDYYYPENERSILWNDKDLQVDWPLFELPQQSAKDLNASGFCSRISEV